MGVLVMKMMNGLSHDKSVLENLLMSFRIKDARDKASDLVLHCDKVEDINNLDLSKYGKDEKKIGFALNSYVKALEFIKTYYK